MRKLALVIVSSSLALGAAKALDALLSGSSPHQLTTLTSVEVVTDRLDPIEGAVVRLDNGSTQVVAATDADGQLPWLALDATSGVELVLAERPVPGGLGLGMIEQVSVPFQAAPGSESFLVTISRTQPLAVPVHVRGKADEFTETYPPTGDHAHWVVGAPQGSTLRLTTSVASLLDTEAIQQFLAYRGHMLDPSLGYVRGVDLVMPAVQLGAGGIVVGLDLLGDLEAGVAVDAYCFTNLPPLVPVGPPLEVSISLVEDGIVYLWIRGGVPKGHLTLLARPESGPLPALHVLQDDPPTILLPPDAGGGVEFALRRDALGETEGVAGEEQDTATVHRPSALALVTNCEPPVPNTSPGWTCDPLPPAGNRCGAAVPSGPKGCKIVRSRSPKICRDPGITHKTTRAKTARWKVSFQLTGFRGSPLQSGGGFEYGEDSQDVTTDEWTAKPGAHGLGQCLRFFRFELICVAPYTIKVGDPFELSNGYTVVVPCAKAVTVYASCRDTDDSSSTCDRTP